MNIQELYKAVFNEDERLRRSNASKIEFLTTMRYIKKYLKKGARILDVGAGTGVYSLALASEGYEVVAFELLGHHCDIIKSKKTSDMNLEVIEGNAIDLSLFSDDSFDLVLNLGPLYHLPKEEDRIKAINESMRVLKDDGYGMFAYINNDMVFITESLMYNEDFLLGDQRKYYDHDSFKVVDKPFTVLTRDYVISLFDKLHFSVIKHVATDGFSELLAKQINSLGEKQFHEWVRFHMYTCEKEEFLGSSHHLLLIVQK